MLREGHVGFDEGCKDGNRDCGFDAPGVKEAWTMRPSA